MILIDGDKHYLTEQEAELVEKALLAGSKYIKLETLFFATHQFSKLINGADYESFERRKHGETYCEKHAQWIPKGKSCGYCG